MTHNVYSSKDFLAPLVTKSAQRSSLSHRNQQGQITFFFAISVVVIVTLMSFVVNVGLFVKAKINLQNATDAAAWSGAATQARQLTDIAYMNWEMRNVYKQWMFKYYVLGNLSARGVRNPGEKGNNNFVTGSSNIMDFTIGPATSKDQYNIPSICIHARPQINSTQPPADVCSIYSVPGLPRLTFGFTSIDQTLSTVADALASEKSTDCAARSNANFNIALAWIYGTGSNNSQIFKEAPHVAINHTGAWVKATEIAHRIRNMEFIVNTPTKSQVGIADVENLSAENFAGNERIVKAFYSAYRNLGNDSSMGSELKNTFVLTELSPQNNAISEDATDLSNLFIPEGGKNFEKPFLDLRLIPLNFVNFFSALVPSSGETAGGTETIGKCQMSKIAIPVPGYPLGFTKNPQVLTYYAVKGEADFRGIFNPLGRSIRLTAYASAKPFGGRIGPPLFNNFDPSSPSSVFARQGRFRSLSYALGLNYSTSETRNLPAIVPYRRDNEAEKFWVDNALSNPVVGGSTADSEKIRYIIPNLNYEGNEIDLAYQKMPFFIYQLPASANGNVPHKLGLYDVAEFKKFKANLTVSDSISSDDVLNALKNVKRPTPYENVNYLIPTSQDLNTELILDSLGLGKINNQYPIYAPLYGDKLLYENSSSILQSIKLFLKTQDHTIENFIAQLKNASDMIRQNDQTGGTQGAISVYADAANFFYQKINGNGGNLNCKSMAGQFYYYFFDSDAPVDLSSCSGFVSLPKSLEEIYSNTAPGSGLNSQLYFLELYYESEGKNLRNHYSAYTPGEQTGANSANTYDSLGSFTNPFLGSTYQSLRNFYSTKLVSMQSLFPNTEQSYGSSGIIPLMSEGSLQDITGQTSFNNPLVLEQENIKDIFQ